MSKAKEPTSLLERFSSFSKPESEVLVKKTFVREYLEDELTPNGAATASGGATAADEEVVVKRGQLQRALSKLPEREEARAHRALSIMEVTRSFNSSAAAAIDPFYVHTRVDREMMRRDEEQSTASTSRQRRPEDAAAEDGRAYLAHQFYLKDKGDSAARVIQAAYRAYRARKISEAAAACINNQWDLSGFTNMVADANFRSNIRERTLQHGQRALKLVDLQPLPLIHEPRPPPPALSPTSATSPSGGTPAKAAWRSPAARVPGLPADASPPTTLSHSPSRTRYQNVLPRYLDPRKAPALCRLCMAREHAAGAASWQYASLEDAQAEACTTPGCVNCQGAPAAQDAQLPLCVRSTSLQRGGGRAAAAAAAAVLAASGAATVGGGGPGVAGGQGPAAMLRVQVRVKRDSDPGGELLEGGPGGVLVGGPRQQRLQHAASMLRGVAEEGTAASTSPAAAAAAAAAAALAWQQSNAGGRSFRSRLSLPLPLGPIRSTSLGRGATVESGPLPPEGAISSRSSQNGGAGAPGGDGNSDGMAGMAAQRSSADAMPRLRRQSAEAGGPPRISGGGSGPPPLPSALLTVVPSPPSMSPVLLSPLAAYRNNSLQRSPDGLSVLSRTQSYTQQQTRYLGASPGRGGTVAPIAGMQASLLSSFMKRDELPAGK